MQGTAIHMGALAAHRFEHHNSARALGLPEHKALFDTDSLLFSDHLQTAKNKSISDPMNVQEAALRAITNANSAEIFRS